MERLPELEAFVKQYLIENDIPLESPKAKRSAVDLIVYGYKKAEWPSATAVRFSKKYLPNKPPNKKLLNYVLRINNKKYCNSCNKIKTLNIDFYEDSSKADNRQSYCKDCQITNTQNTQSKRREYYMRLNRLRANKYRAAKLNRAPSWSDLDKIKEIYENCPDGHHVDHIIPLQGERVSGLHVPENLQYLTISENCSKGNKFQIE